MNNTRSSKQQSAPNRPQSWKLLLRAVLAALLVVFLVSAPPLLSRELARNPYREFLRGEEDTPGFRGILTVWHVVAFKPAQGSITTLLSGAGARYEAQHDGVYIEVTGMDAAAAGERIARGQRPDIWSVGYASLGDYTFLPITLDNPALRGGLSPYKVAGEVHALPYLYSGYFFIGNIALLQKLGLSFPNAAMIQAAQAQNAGELIAHVHAAAMSPAAAQHGALRAPARFARAWGLGAVEEEAGDFKAGQVPFFIGDARAYGDLSRKLADGGFAFEAFPLGGETELVQYIALDANMDEARYTHAVGYIRSLFSGDLQARVVALGAMPATVLPAPVPYSDALLQAMQGVYEHPLLPQRTP